MTESFFGNNPPDPNKEGAGHGDNPLGLPNKQEPAPTEPPEQGHPGPAPQQAPEREEEGHPEPEERKQEGRILGKYQNHQEVQEALINIGRKLGKDVNWEAMYKEGTQEVDPEKLEDAYQQAQQQLGQTSDIDQTRSKLSQMEEENQKLKQLTKTYQAYLQRMMAPQRMGQPHPQQPQQFQQQPPQQQAPHAQMPQQPQQQEEEYDPDQFFDEFYKKGPEAIQKIVEKSIQKYQQPQQPQAPPTHQNFGQYQQPQQPRPNVDYSKQVMELKNKYGQDFEEMKEDVGQVLKDPKNRYLLHLDDGMERAFNKAKLQRRRSQREEAKKKAESHQMEVFKNAAQISPGQARTGERRLGQEEWEKKQIFDQARGKGFFG